jgi:hypothetical protein
MCFVLVLNIVCVRSHVQAPTVIFPHRAADRYTEAIVLDLGHFLLRSVLSSERQHAHVHEKAATNSPTKATPTTTNKEQQPQLSEPIQMQRVDEATTTQLATVHAGSVRDARANEREAKELAARCYDRFDVELTGISVVIYQDISKFIV